VRRIVIVSARPAFAAEHASALAAVSEARVETLEPARCAGDAQPTALWIVDLAESGAVPDVPGRILAMAPRAELGAWLDLLAASDQVVCVIAADAAPAELATLVERLLDDTPVDLATLLGPEAEVHERTVGDYFEKQRCIAKVVAISKRLKLPRRTQTSIDQCLDELAMNALFDAPVDRSGQHVFAGVPIGRRVLQRTDATVSVRFGWDAKTFAFAVSDEFGTLSRATVLAHIAKGLHANAPVDRKAGGAGLGLYLTVSLASAVWFDVVPGRRTDIVCAFDRETIGGPLARFGFRVRNDPDGESAPRATRSRPALSLPARCVRQITSHPWIATGIVAALLTAAIAPRIIDRLGPPRLEIDTSPGGATVELEGHRIATTEHGPAVFGDLERGRTYAIRAHLDGYRSVAVARRVHAGTNTVQLPLAPAATVELASTPAGAAVQIDGRSVGRTPLELDDLPPSTTVRAVFTLAGYRTASAQIHVPAVTQRTRVVQPLVLADGVVLVHFESDPPGAAIVRTGEAPSSDRSYTPADVRVEAGTVQRFSLEMPGHATVEIPPFTVSPGSPKVTKRATLPETP
jgi:hypothetical protein